MSPAADSAGVPFDGREFRPHPFAGDDGGAPEQLAMALDRYAREQSSAAVSQVVEALRRDRILVPLIAEAGDIGHTPEGRVVEKTQELSIVSVQGPDGQAVGLVFSDVTSLQAWRPDARPQPAEAARAAAWALEESMSRLVINPTSATECLLRRGALVALITGESYIAPWEDPEVAEAIEQGVGQSGTVMSIRSGWDSAPAGPDLVVEIGLPPGLSAEQLRERQQGWAAQWSASDVIARRVDGMQLALVAL